MFRTDDKVARNPSEVVRNLVQLATEANEVGTELRLSYVDVDGDPTERFVIPESMYTSKDGNVLLVGYCILRQAIRSFRVDRMVTVTISDPNPQ